MVKRGGKVPCSKETRKLTRKDSVITFSSWNIPGKIKTDNDLNIRRKQTSSLTPASNHLHTTSSSSHCTSCAGYWGDELPTCCVSYIPSTLTSILTAPSESHSLRTLDSPAFNCHRQHQHGVLFWTGGGGCLVWLRTWVQSKDCHYRTLFSERASGSSLPDIYILKSTNQLFSRKTLNLGCSVNSWLDLDHVCLSGLLCKWWCVFLRL